ncbi:unnamed protein product [Echinostoma caproni]|uniref:Uncharacterized protein n=1 Tax=Echinostoma caproni TaxID=27848 RepID=A0A183B6M2_9TREM|nr:unnamed protein product [Echinostoma caproni]
MCSLGLMKRLKQSKDPSVLREFNSYLKFRAKLAMANARIQFLDEFISNLEYPKQYRTVLRRNCVNITNMFLGHQALNQRNTLSIRLLEMERNFLKSSRVLDELAAEEETEFVA